MSFKGWRIACVWLLAACGGSDAGGADMQPTGGNKSTSMQPAAAGKSGSGGGGGGASGSGSGGATAGSSGDAGAPTAAPPTAVAMIMSFKAPPSTGAAGAGGAAGAAGKAGSGSGAGFAVVYGQASFTKLGPSEVDVEVEVMGCDNGKSYPVHIHEGTSCDSVMSQGGHWGAAEAAAGSGGAPATMLRGEGIPDIKCTGTTGVAAGKRDTTDKSLLWTIGTMDETDVVGHVIVVHDGADRIACGKIELKK